MIDYRYWIHVIHNDARRQHIKVILLPDILLDFVDQGNGKIG